MNPDRISLPLALSLAGAAVAGESTNYSISPETQSAGGRVASTNYTLDASTASGGISGGVASSAAFTLRDGFAGGINDPVGLDLTASPLTVNEGGTRQLAASLLLDDGSRVGLAPSGISWLIAGGPLTAISTDGVATAGIVYQNTDATASGSYASFSDSIVLGVLNTGSDDFGIYAGDSIDDDWQVRYFGANNPTAGPAHDTDSDGLDNLFEFTAGLDPTDRASTFTLRVETVPGQPAHRRIIFQPRLDSRTYTLLAGTGLTAWEPLAGAAVSDVGNERTVTDTAATTPGKFYRVRIQKP